QVVNDTRVSLVLLRLRLVDYWNVEVYRAFAKADILIEGDEVEPAMNDVNHFVLTELVGWFQDAESKDQDLSQILKGIDILESKLRVLRDTMYEELEAT